MKTRKLTNNQKTIRVLIPGLLVILGTGYLMFPDVPRDIAENAKFAYCRKCDKETRHIPGEVLPPCLKCGRETVGLAESIKKNGNRPKNPYWPTFIACYSEAIVTLALLYHFTKPSAVPKDDKEDYLNMRCPNCKRKLRYRETQQGNLGQCPMCKKPLKFPVRTVPESERHVLESQIGEG